MTGQGGGVYGTSLRIRVYNRIRDNRITTLRCNMFDMPPSTSVRPPNRNPPTPPLTPPTHPPTQNPLPQTPRWWEPLGSLVTLAACAPPPSWPKPSAGATRCPSDTSHPLLLRHVPPYSSDTSLVKSIAAGCSPRSLRDVTSCSGEWNSLHARRDSRASEHATQKAHLSG